MNMNKVGELIPALILALLVSSAVTADEKIGDNSVYQFKGEPIRDVDFGKTYLTWLGKTGDINAREYDNTDGTWYPALDEPPKIIKEFTRDPPDRHNYASVVVAPDGHLVVFQTDHLTESDGYAIMVYKSPQPGTIEGTWSSQELWDGVNQPSYPTMVRAGDSIYLFIRRRVESVHRVWQFSKSTDSGRIWSEPRTIIDTGELEDGQVGYQPEGFDEVYAVGRKYFDEANHRIPISWHLAGDGRHNKFNRNMYVAYLDTRDDQMYSPNGMPLGDFIDLAEMNSAATKCLVEATPPLRGKYTGGLVDFVHQVSFDDDGKFLVAYNFMDEPDEVQRLRYGKWTGTSWTVGSIEEAPLSANPIRISSMVKIPGSDAFRVTVVEDATHTVRIRETKDGGQHWPLIAFKKLDTAGKTINSADFVVPYNPGFPQVLVTTYPIDDKYNTTLPGDYPVIAIDHVNR